MGGDHCWSPPPFKTVRNPFALHGSSRWQSLAWRPSPLGSLPGGELVVAVDVDRLKVARLVCSPMSRGNDVMHLQVIVVPKDESTVGAVSVLAAQETGHGGVRRPMGP